jgi:hypothetical protein
MVNVSGHGKVGRQELTVVIFMSCYLQQPWDKLISIFRRPTLECAMTCVLRYYTFLHIHAEVS